MHMTFYNQSMLRAVILRGETPTPCKALLTRNAQSATRVFIAGQSYKQLTNNLQTVYTASSEVCLCAGSNIGKVASKRQRSSHRGILLRLLISRVNCRQGCLQAGPNIGKVAYRRRRSSQRGILLRLLISRVNCRQGRFR